MVFTLQELLGFFLTFVRGGILFMNIPVFAGKAVPVRLRIAFAAAIAWLIGGAVPQVPLGPHTLELVMALASEIAAGYLLVLGARMLFFAVEFAGQIMAGEIGLAMTSGITPDTGTSSTAVSQALFYFTAMLFLLSSGPLLVLKAFLMSFTIMPAGSSFGSHFNFFALLKASTTVFSLGLQLAAPVVAINFLVNIVFAILGKAIPRMNVFMTSFSVRIAAGFIVFLSIISLLAATLTESVRGIAASALSSFIS